MYKVSPMMSGAASCPCWVPTENIQAAWSLPTFDALI